MKKSRTPLGGMLQRAFAKALLLEKRKNRFANLADLEEYQFLESRRKFLKTGITAGGVILAGGFLQSCAALGGVKNLKRDTRIAIVGGGIAGLAAAYELKKAGWFSTIYEASKRTGGRMYTGKNLVADGITTEIGGEFYDTGHPQILALCKELDLELIDTQTPEEKKLHGELFYFNGRLYSEEEVIEAFRPLAVRIEADLAKVTDEIGYTSSTADEKKLDNTSLAEYLGSMPMDDWFFELMDAAYTSEMGVDIGNQSSLNLITFISTETEAFKIFGSSDERYKTKGGNQQVVDRLAEKLPDQIQTDHILEAIFQNGNATVLKFANGKEVNADVVILALPFTKLREVDIRIDLPPAKKYAIQNLNYGTNSKLMFGMNRRVWREQGYSGYLFDKLWQNGWDSSQMQTNNMGPGSYTSLLGGKVGLSVGMWDHAPYLAQLDKVFSGAKDAWNGKKSSYNWGTYPHNKGSYSAYSVGQWTSICGAEGEPVGNIFFAGEHCSSDYQGFMNGGLVTGQQAAKDALAMMGVKVK